ncbi:hypothetical protein PN498_27040 [Oscillatoria sp. CS-180]|nr:hypothetical protein [Oscillatoria sp. CS-180]
MKPQTLKKDSCLKNERGLHHGIVNLLWIGWTVLELPLVLPYHLLLIVCPPQTGKRGKHTPAQGS